MLEICNLVKYFANAPSFGQNNATKSLQVKFKINENAPPMGKLTCSFLAIVTMFFLKKQ